MLLVPTRELALQTAQVAKELGKHLAVEVMVTTGGTSLKDDIMRLYQPVHVVVATPGRILDLGNKGVCKLNACRCLVMDEVRRGDGWWVGWGASCALVLRRCTRCAAPRRRLAAVLGPDPPSRRPGCRPRRPPPPKADKLLSPEFQPLIEQLISFLPEDRQIMLFSATFPVTVKQFKEKFLKKPYVRRARGAPGGGVWGINCFARAPSPPQHPLKIRPPNPSNSPRPHRSSTSWTS
jgi:ATP-dependent RNA helicase DDX6/DHH1